MNTSQSHNDSTHENLMQAERIILEMMQEGRMDEAIDKYLMEEAMVCPPGMDRIIGKEKQKIMFKELLKIDGFEFTWKPLETHIGPSDDMACVYGSVEWKLPGETRQEGKYISIWVKKNGTWKNMVEMRNANH